jgi:hypothetical protein
MIAAVGRGQGGQMTNPWAGTGHPRHVGQGGHGGQGARMHELCTWSVRRLNWARLTRTRFASPCQRSPLT